MAHFSNFSIDTLIIQMKRRRVWPFFWLVLTGSITIAGWLAWPAISEPYVRIPNSTFMVPMTCIPKEITLDSRTQYATFARSRVLIENSYRTRLVAQYDPIGTAVRTSSGIIVTITIPEKTRRDIHDALMNYGESGHLGLRVEFSKRPSIDLTNLAINYDNNLNSTKCGNEALKDKDLFTRLSASQPALMYFDLIQDRISDMIFSANEISGNILLAVLVLTLLWLFVLLTTALRQVYFQSDKALHSLICSSDSTPDSESVRMNDTRIVAEHHRIVRSIMFARVLGPATGFLLTVSSLVAGLHPSSTGGQDTFRLLSSLQLALVATFMGLAVRIVAEFCIRYQQFATERKLALIATEKAPAP